MIAIEGMSVCSRGVSLVSLVLSSYFNEEHVYVHSRARAWCLCVRSRWNVHVEGTRGAAEFRKLRAEAYGCGSNLAIGLAAPVGATIPSQPTHPVQMGPQNKAKDYCVPYSRHRLTTGGLQLPYGRSSGY